MRGTAVCGMRVANLWLTLECNHIHLKNCITFGLALNCFNAFLLRFASSLSYICTCAKLNGLIVVAKWQTTATTSGADIVDCMSEKLPDRVTKIWWNKQIVHNYYGMSIGKHKQKTHTYTHANIFMNVFVWGSNWPVTCVARMNISRKRIFDSRRPLPHPLALLSLQQNVETKRIIVLPCAIQCAGPDPHGQQTVQIASVFECVCVCVCVVSFSLFSALIFGALLSFLVLIVA